MINSLDIERIILRALENHERSLEQRERQLEEYINLSTEEQIKTVERLYRFEKRLKLEAIELFCRVPNARPPVLRDYVDDWDYNYTEWGLDGAEYVSPPSSLKIHRAREGNAPSSAVCFLCKYSPTLTIPNGRIITYAKTNNTSYNVHQIFMRNNSSVGDANNRLGYSLYFGRSTDSALWRDNSLISGTKISLPNMLSWVRFRITWFSSENGFEVHLEYWNGSEWVLLVAYVDPDDMYSDISPCRCGIGGNVWRNGTNAIWYDDTEIWSA